MRASMRGDMVKRMQFFVVMVMLALVPVRALAGVTAGMCAAADHEAVHHVHSVHSDSSGHADDDEGRPSGPDTDCGTCVEHCASAVVAVAFPASPLPTVKSGDRPSCRHISDLRFVPEHLDPPPLAS